MEDPPGQRGAAGRGYQMLRISHTIPVKHVRLVIVCEKWDWDADRSRGSGKRAKARGGQQVGVLVRAGAGH